MVNRKQKMVNRKAKTVNGKRDIGSDKVAAPAVEQAGLDLAREVFERDGVVCVFVQPLEQDAHLRGGVLNPIFLEKLAQVLKFPDAVLVQVVFHE